MDVGRMVHTVTLQRPTGQRDDFGERDTVWREVATVNGFVEPLTGREQFLAAQQQASTTHKVSINWHSVYADVNANWRLKYGERVFTIDSVRNIREANELFELICTEGLRDE